MNLQGKLRLEILLADSGRELKTEFNNWMKANLVEVKKIIVKIPEHERGVCYFCYILYNEKKGA